MRITITSIEADPSEIAELPELREAIARLGGGVVASTSVDTEAGVGSDVGDVWDFIRLRGRGNPDLELITEFVKMCLEFEGAEAVIGRSKTSPDGFGDYLMVRHASHLKGAFVYVTPSSGKLAFRLTGAAASDLSHAVAIDTKDPNYQVRVMAKSADAIEEANELAELAYDGVTP